MGEARGSEKERKKKLSYANDVRHRFTARDSIFHVFNSTAHTTHTHTRPTIGLLFHFRHCKTKPIRPAATALRILYQWAYLPNLSIHFPARTLIRTVPLIRIIRIRLIKKRQP